MGIENAQDGVDKVLSGCVRQVDVMEYQDEVEHSYFLDRASYGGMVDGTRRTNKMKGLLGAKTAAKLSAVASIAENSEYWARIEVPEGEVSEEFRQLIAQPSAYSCVAAHSSQQTRAGGHVFPLCTSARLDDGHFELVLFKSGSRKDRIKCFSEVRETGGLVLSETVDTMVSFASVTSMTVTAMSREGSARQHTGDQCAQVDGDNIGGSPFRISMAPTKQRVFA
jgi:diacylglycerol kinase family enzyme